MKYLVTVRRRDVPMPPGALAEILLAQREWVQEKLDDGTFDAAYTFAQGGGGCSVTNAESHDELGKIMMSAPVYPVATLDVQPLTHISSLEGAAQALRRLAAVAA